MSARITANTTAVAVSEVRPRMSVSVVNASAKATASVAAAEIDYIELTLGAYLDTTGKFKFFGELAVMVDALRINTSKQLADNFTLADLVARTPRKALADSTSTSDQITSRNTAKLLADTFGTTEAVVRGVTKALSDSFTVTDQISNKAVKNLADTFGLSDANTRAVSKLIADSVSFTETFSSVLIFIRNIADSVAALDRAAITTTKAPFSESVSTLDASTLSLTKLIGDAVAMDDGTSVGDGSTYFLQKNVNNVVLLSDAAARSTAKIASDSISFADSGIVVMQSYCDLTYFADDYVGTSSTF